MSSDTVVTVQPASTSIGGSEIRWAAYDPQDEEYLFVMDRYGDMIVRWHIATDTKANFVGAGSAGFADGVGTDAMFKRPQQFAASPDGTFLLVTDTNNHRIRKVIVQSGVNYKSVSTIAGGSSGNADGAALSAQFHSPSGIAIANDATVFVTDRDNDAIRKISSGYIDLLVQVSLGCSLE